MSKCFRCQAETELFVNGLPLCIACAERAGEHGSNLYCDSEKEPECVLQIPA